MTVEKQRQRRQRDKNLAFAGTQNLLEGQMAFAFVGLEIGFGQESAKPSVGLPIGRVGQHLETVDGDQPRADEKFYVSVLGFVIGAHHAGKAVAVGDADGGEAERIGRRHHLSGMRGAAQEGKVGGDGELGIGAHRSHSRKQAVHEPARRCRFPAVKAFAVEPEAMTLAVFDEVVIAGAGFCL
jgi:hypothetical protein